MARRVPGERLLVETDAPYLSPVPMRGKRNEPAFVRYTAGFLAELRGEPAEQLAQSKPQRKLFPIVYAGSRVQIIGIKATQKPEGKGYCLMHRESDLRESSLDA